MLIKLYKVGDLMSFWVYCFVEINDKDNIILIFVNVISGKKVMVSIRMNIGFIINFVNRMESYLKNCFKIFDF